MSTEFESRFSSQKPEDIAWRVNVAHIDAAIEGIERHPVLAKMVDDMDDQNISIEEQIERIIAFDFNTINEAAE